MDPSKALSLMDVFPPEHVEKFKQHLRECPECAAGISKIVDKAFKEWRFLGMILSPDDLKSVINSQLQGEKSNASNQS